jgi:hypothetical protein
MMRKHHMHAHHPQHRRDALVAVRGRARRERRTAGKVLSDLTRQALTGGHRSDEPLPGRHGFSPLPRRGPAVSNSLIEKLREDEDEDEGE